MFWIHVIVWCAVGALAGWALRKLPAGWLCDYGETPSEEHSAAHRRLKWWQLLLFALGCGVCSACIMLQVGDVLHTVKGMLCGLTAAVLVSALLLAAVCDAKYGILPDQLLILSAVAGIALWLLGGLSHLKTWYAPLLGAAVGFFGLWAVMAVASLLYKGEAMGFGDVKLMGVLGLVCGMGGLGIAVIVAVLTAALCFAVLLAFKKVQRRDAFPFGPFLVGGALFSLCLRPLWLLGIIWYLRLL